MKKLYGLLVVILCATALHAQTLFTYGNTNVDKDEFLRAYNKNKTPETDKKKALTDYLDLYTKFKLKVRAAQDLRLDTLPQLQSDIQNFRTQVEDSYMTDQPAVDLLDAEAFDRSQEDVHVIHFFIPIDPKMSPEDTAKAWRAINEVYDELKKGRTDYTMITDAVSAKTFKVSARDLGYITAFTVPYEYENIIYGLKPGESNAPYRSHKGLHIFRVVEKKKSSGKWKVAQILLTFPPNVDPSYSKTLQHRADSIYQLLEKGASFSEMARQFSDDKLTYMNGGEMPEFSTGKFEYPFEKQVFSLSKDGEITKPFTTEFGVHIVKRLSVTPTPADKSDAGYSYEIKQKVLLDNRINAAKEKFNRTVLAKIAYKKAPSVKDAELFRYADSVVANPAPDNANRFPISNKVIFTFEKSSLKGVDWLNFIRDYKTSPTMYKGESNPALLEKFTEFGALAYYRDHLEEYNPDFRYQMQEFRDGNMLFEVMERNVWGSAATDSAGLLSYYAGHKSKYLWGASADVIIFNCTNKKIAEDALATLKDGKDWKKIAEDGNSNIQADSGRYELAQIAFPAGVTPAPGLITPIVVNNNDGASSFIKLLRLRPAGEQRSFEEARGLVINDYQTVLEDKWIAELKKKYPVRVNDAVFQSLLK